MEVIDGNVSMLQSAIRRLGLGFPASLLEPYADWRIVDGTQAFSLMSTRTLDNVTSDWIASRLSRSSNDDTIATNLARAWDQYETGYTAFDSFKGLFSKKGQMPKNIESKLSLVKQYGGENQRYEWEAKLIETVVNPGTFLHQGPR